MNCDVCGRRYHTQRLPFLCPVDARNRLYEHRLAHAAMLIQNEQLERIINDQLASADGADTETKAGTGTGTSTSTGAGPATSKSRLEAWESERQTILDRTSDVAARTKKLRTDLAEARRALERRRTSNTQRRSDLEAATNGTAARRARMQDEVERAIGMTRFKWNRSYDAMAATRGFLCMEAAKLYGLRRLKKGSAVRYEIGGREVVDPFTMSNLSPEVISTSLGHVTHILMLACHYLSIRLPAEVTLPHRDYPRPTIFSLSSSYSHGDVPFPGTAAFQPPSAGSRGSRDPFQRVPRARPLYIDKQLPVLAKEDNLTHTMFLEGVALLAYDIAWACGSQGVPVGDKSSLDDVFNIGRNLYNLLIGNQLLNNPAGRIFSAAPAGSVSPSGARGGARSPDATGSVNRDMTVSMMGRYSHGTTHTFLADDVIQSFKLPSPNRLADRLKARLSSESTLPDWEVLEDDAWTADDHSNMEDGVLTRGEAWNDGSSTGGGIPIRKKRLFGVESMATVMASPEDTISRADLLGSIASSRAPQKQQQLSQQQQSPPPQQQHYRMSGTSGWTKLRNRSGSKVE